MDSTKAEVHEEGCLPSSDEHDARPAVDGENEEDESFIELSPEVMWPASEFEFRRSFSPPTIPGPARSSADELFTKGRILPLGSIEISKTDSSAPPTRREVPLSRSHSSPGVCRPPLEIGASTKLPTDCVDRRSASPLKDKELTGTRRPSNVAMLLTGGVMKFLVKLPLEKIRSTFSSVVKSLDDFCSSSKSWSKNGGARETDSGRRRRLLPISKWTPARRSKGEGLHGRKICTTDHQLHQRKSRKQRKSAIIADSLRGALDSLNLSFRGRNVDFRSSPGSTFASPAGPKGALQKDNSVGAAIAHCKKSFEFGDGLQR